MSSFRLLLRNLFYHWRGNLAVFLGIVLGSAVLTGALLVGDSLRGSLKTLTLDQLGWIDEALVPGRFFRAALAGEVSAERRSAALMLQGSVSRQIDKETRRVGKVTVLGVDASFWPPDQPVENAEFWASAANEVVLNQALASALEAKVGDSIRLHVQRAGNIPGETALADRKAEKVIETLRVKIRAILPDAGMARFSLKPTPEPVRNAFVPIGLLQKKLDLPGLVNALFVAKAKPTLQADLHKQLTLDDWGLRVNAPTDRAEALVKLLDPRNDDGNLKESKWEGRLPDPLAKAAQENGNILSTKMIADFYKQQRDYALLTSRRTILEPTVIEAVRRIGVREAAAERFPAYANPIVIALADSIRDDSDAELPYSIVAGLDVERVFAPLGSLADDEIVMVEPPATFKEKKEAAAPLKAKVGDWLTLEWYAPTSTNHLEKRSHKFKVKSVSKLEGKLDDPDLTPEFPGITDNLDIAKWDPANLPFPYDNKRGARIEEYWKRYRTTPRAYVNLKIAKELWGTRFGDITSIQLVGSPATFGQDLLMQLKPEDGGFLFMPVRAQAVNASAGATDFGGLFLAFSFFLIVSALLLVGLLVRLNIDRRAAEMGLLLATGWSHRQVRRLLLAEGALLTLVGAAVGLAGALLYGWLMLKLLAANWPSGSSLNFMRLHAEPASFAIGYAASVIVSLLTLIWATRVLGNLSPRALLSGEATASAAATDAKPLLALRASIWLIPGGIVGSLAMVAAAPFIPSHMAQVLTFFGSGALLLTACIAAAWNALKWMARASSPQPTLSKLGLRNAGRHAVRSVLTVGLLAAASFLIVAVESFHKSTDQDFHKQTGGSGGFAFLAEASVPVLDDLNQEVVREHYEFGDALKNVKFYPCRVQPGDDASCLNLYKPLKPRVMGVPQTLIERGGFHFGGIKKGSSVEEEKNPWLLLQTKFDDDAIPAIIDANTAQWILKVGLGDDIEVKNEKAEMKKLRIVALLAESIFQSEVLVSEKHFSSEELYRSQSGYSFFLIDTGGDGITEKQLQKPLDELNMDVQTTASRLEGYLAVENTYLTTFQALGGLGLLLGAAGLAIVLLRGVWERRAELALLQALGFRSGQLAWLVLVENAFLLVLGLAAGTVSALVAVAPHLIGAGAQVLWLRIGGLLLAVLVVGLLAAALAVFSAARTPVLTALRRE